MLTNAQAAAVTTARSIGAHNAAMGWEIENAQHALCMMLMDLMVWASVQGVGFELAVSDAAEVVAEVYRAEDIAPSDPLPGYGEADTSPQADSPALPSASDTTALPSEPAPIDDGVMLPQAMVPLLGLSTSHLTGDTCNRYLPLMRSCCYAKGDYGYFIYAAGEAIQEDDPADLKAVLTFAAAAGVEWVMFDQDLPTVFGLTTYDWEA